MNKLTWISIPAIAVALVLAGCGGSKETSSPPAVEKAPEAPKPAAAEATKTAETSAQEAEAAGQDAYGKLLNAFESADATTRSSVQSAVDLAKAAKYSEALKELQAIAAKTKLTPEQEQLLKDVIGQVQKQMASSGVQGAVQDATKSLPIGK